LHFIVRKDKTVIASKLWKICQKKGKKLGDPK